VEYAKCGGYCQLLLEEGTAQGAWTGIRRRGEAWPQHSFTSEQSDRHFCDTFGRVRAVLESFLDEIGLFEDGFDWLTNTVQVPILFFCDAMR